MKFILSVMLLLTAAPLFAQSAMTAEEIELERQRLQLEREQIELEKQKLELEKMRMEAAQKNTAPAPVPTLLAAPKKSPFTKDLYVGLDYILSGQGERTVTIDGIDEAPQAFTVRGGGLKFGFGAPDENRVEIFYYKERLAFEGSDNDWDVTVSGIDYLFVFFEAFDKNLSPYLKIGLASAQSDSYTKTVQEMGYPISSGDSTIGGGGLRMGYGLFTRLDDEFEVTLGVDATLITWQELMLTNISSQYKIVFDDTINTFFVNVDYFF